MYFPYWFCSILLVFSTVYAQTNTLCLNMIVRDESDVILRSLSSVIDLIDYWVIVDTGSRDDTIDKICTFLEDIPGELHERPWKNFGANRSEAFLLAQGKADYILFMDADDVLEFEETEVFTSLKQDCYHLWRGQEGFSYLTPQIVKGNLDWKWIGVTHEYLDCAYPYTSEILDGVRYVTKEGGACSKHPTQKFLRNIQLLEKDLQKDPGNARSMFYLAESYRDAHQPGKALACYQKRIQMGGWEEEVFWSYLQTAFLVETIGLSKRVVERAYLDAHEYRKKRIEPVYFLAKMHNKHGEYAMSYSLIKKYLEQPKYTRDILFNIDWIEEYGLLFEYSIAGYYIGKTEEACSTVEKLLALPQLPEEWKACALRNRALMQNRSKV